MARAIDRPPAKRKAMPETQQTPSSRDSTWREFSRRLLIASSDTNPRLACTDNVSTEPAGGMLARFPRWVSVAYGSASC
jgi:hypothetical protein